MPAGPATRPATFKTTWQDGKLVTTMPAEGPRGRGPIAYQETRSLTADGALVVEITDPSRGNTRRLVYRRN
jgi:hypothetical protein